jgi:hypothetical protein
MSPTESTQDPLREALAEARSSFEAILACTGWATTAGSIAEASIAGITRALAASPSREAPASDRDLARLRMAVRGFLAHAYGREIPFDLHGHLRDLAALVPGSTPPAPASREAPPSPGTTEVAEIEGLAREVGKCSCCDGEGVWHMPCPCDACGWGEGPCGGPGPSDTNCDDCEGKGIHPKAAALLSAVARLSERLAAAEKERDEAHVLMEAEAEDRENAERALSEANRRAEEAREAAESWQETATRERNRLIAEANRETARAERAESIAKAWEAEALLRETNRADAVARAERAEGWQLAVADALGYVNRAEGQSGYEVAEPSVVLAAYRAALSRPSVPEEGPEALREALAWCAEALDMAAAFAEETQRIHYDAAFFLGERTAHLVKDACRESEKVARASLAAVPESGGRP